MRQYPHELVKLKNKSLFSEVFWQEGHKHIQDTNFPPSDLLFHILKHAEAYKHIQIVYCKKSETVSAFYIF